MVVHRNNNVKNSFLIRLYKKKFFIISSKSLFWRRTTPRSKVRVNVLARPNVFLNVLPRTNENECVFLYLGFYQNIKSLEKVLKKYLYKYTDIYTYYSYPSTCKYTKSSLWIVIWIPLTTCKMKWISSIIAKSLNKITILWYFQ